MSTQTYTDTVVITGGTTGLGYEAARQLASQRPLSQIIIASRNDRNDAAGTINKLTHQSNVSFMPLDLGSLDNIRAFVSVFKSRNFPPISILMQNAGLQFHNGIHFTPDGIETTFAVNHVGHALLFFLLKPFFINSARIVITASGVHDPAQKTMVPDAQHESAELLAHPAGEKADPKWSGLQRYSSSKLANVLWGYALERHLLEDCRKTGKKDWTVVTMDPGLMPGTSLGRDMAWPIPWIAQNILTHMVWLLRLLVTKNAHSVQESASALVRLAVEKDSEIKGVSGEYFQGFVRISSSKDSYDEVKQDDLWNWTLQTVPKDEQERSQFLNV